MIILYLYVCNVIEVLKLLFAQVLEYPYYLFYLLHLYFRVPMHMYLLIYEMPTCQFEPYFFFNVYISLWFCKAAQFAYIVDLSKIVC